MGSIPPRRTIETQVGCGYTFADNFISNNENAESICILFLCLLLTMIININIINVLINEFLMNLIHLYILLFVNSLLQTIYEVVFCSICAPKYFDFEKIVSHIILAGGDP